jgi:hypothetical protein
MEQAERSTAPLRAEIDRSAAVMREFLGDEDEGPPPPEPKPARAAQAHQPTAPLPSPLPPRPAFEVDPPKDLLAALREAFPGFKPTDRWWSHVERELKDAHHRSNPEAHDAFCRDYRNWSAGDLRSHLEEEGRIPPRQRGRRRKRTVDNLDVHQWIAAQVVKDSGFRHLSQREAAKLSIGLFSARAIGTSPVWREMKRQLALEVREAGERASEEFEGRLGEDEDGHGMRVGRKHALGRQRASKKDRERYRAADAFIAFDRWLKDRGIPWPTLESGRLDLSDDCFRSQAKARPAVAEELRKHYSAIGPEGRSG